MTVHLPMILVEDIKLIRENLLATMAEAFDIDVLGTAETAAEGVFLAAEFGDKWRIAIIDLALKEGTGLTVLKACKTRGPHQRAVVLTNYATEDVRSRCLAFGADAVFDKSTELDLFLKYCELLVH